MYFSLRNKAMDITLYSFNRLQSYECDTVFYNDGPKAMSLNLEPVCSAQMA